MNEHRLKELLGSYLLGGLSDEEERDLEEHLESCPECRRELAELREAHEFMREPSWSPPPELKERVLSQADATTVSRVRPGDETDEERTAHDAEGTDQSPRHRRHRVRQVAAASLVAAGLLVAAFLLGGMLPDALPNLGGPDETIALSPTGIVPEASGEVRVSESGSNYDVVLEVQRLPEPPGDGFYELWFVGDEGRTSAGTFRTSSEGRATVRLTVPSNPRTYERLGITYEPADGDPMPSGEKILGADLGEGQIAISSYSKTLSPEKIRPG